MCWDPSCPRTLVAGLTSELPELGFGEVAWLPGQDRGWGTAKRTAQLVLSWARGCSRHLGNKRRSPKGIK